MALAATVAGLFGLVFLAQVLLLPPSPFGGVENPGAWNPPRDRAELLIAKMDGHAFAEIATDPAMTHTVDAYRGDVNQAAYRSSRPLAGWLYFVVSAGGRRVLLAPAILLVTALGVGAVVLMTDRLGAALGTEIKMVGLVLATPAMVATLAYPGICEPIAFPLALGGLTMWCRQRTWMAVALFGLAALTRETTLLIPLGLGIEHFVRTKSLRAAWPLVFAPLTYVGWVGVVYARLGALPKGSSPMGGPLAGLIASIPHWRLAEWCSAALLVISAIVIVSFGNGWMKTVLLCHGLFAVLMDEQVWWIWWGFGRVATVVPILALVAWSGRAATAGSRCQVSARRSSQLDPFPT